MTQAATARAVDRLNRFQLQVLEAAIVLPEPVSVAQVQGALLAATPSQVGEVITELALLGLLWGPHDQLRATAMVKETLGRFPAGLGPTLFELGVDSPPDLLASVANLPDDVSEILGHLTWGPPTGRIENADRHVTIESAHTPIEWLLARGVLVPLDKVTVVLPREIALVLRDGQVAQHAETDPPPVDVIGRDQRVVDRAAAGTASDLVRLTDDLLELWSVDAPSVLRSGGVGVRDVRSIAHQLNADEAAAVLTIEVAHAAGLLASSGDVDDTWLPTPAYDVWRTQDVARRWLDLAHAWLESTRAVGLIGAKDNKEARINALAPDLDRVVLPDIKVAVLRDLAELPEGKGATVDSLVVRQAWRRPRRGGSMRDHYVRWTLSEAAAMGLASLDAATTALRALLVDDIEGVLAAVGEHLPASVDHVMLQADLTAVAPGPLDSDRARELSLMADRESAGGASVFRFSDASIRRALDAGRSSPDLLAFLTRTSATPVPQPLSYLIEDVARRHGRIRVGTASAYIRSEDPTVLDELMADRRSDALRLRRLAPTVLATQASPDIVLDRLRQMNLAPAAESTDGSVIVRRPDSRRTGPRQRPPRLLADPPAPNRAVAEAAVRALRSGERGSEREPSVAGPASGHELPRTAVAETIELLRGAVEAKRAVWLGYVSTDGVAAERVVDPVEVRGGWLTAYDHRVESVRTFAIHRITGVSLLEAGSG